jgi:hypothetical protein
MDFDFIHPRLAVGGTHGRTTANDIEEIVAAGITHVVNLRSTPEMLFFATPRLSCLENGVVDDGQSKPNEWFLRSLQFALLALARPGKKVLCSCYLGQDRGPSTALAILLAQGQPLVTAEKMIRSARPIVTLAYARDAVRAVRELNYA